MCLCFRLVLSKGEKKIQTHDVPQAVPHFVVKVQRLGVVILKSGSRSVFGLHVSGVDVAGSVVSFHSFLDHLLLEPFHLKRKTSGTCTAVVRRMFFCI